MTCRHSWLCGCWAWIWSGVDPTVLSAGQRCGRALQGTGKRWAEPGHCARLRNCRHDWMKPTNTSAEDYPYVGGQSRGQVYPTLAFSGRPYSLAWEEEHWNWTRVQQPWPSMS